jgi:hypothetical protein
MIAVTCQASTFAGVMIALALAGTGCTPPLVQPTANPATMHAWRASRAEATACAVSKTAPPGKGRGLERASRAMRTAHIEMPQDNFGLLSICLDAGSDQARAHKYLAFITCVSGREKSCRDEFRKAFDADPSFNLAAAEVGHPIWGPVFRSVKADVAVKANSK